MNATPQPRRRSACSIRRSAQRGLTLIEWMVSITVGLFLVTGLATLIASQSATRAEIDRTGRMIENGRYALQTMTDDIRLAGYWGEMASEIPAAPGALPDPCSLASATLDAAIPLHVQGYDNTNVHGGVAMTCVGNYLAGTDVLVVRHSATSSVALGAAVEGQTYIQTGLTASGLDFEHVLGVGSGDAVADAALFDLEDKDGASAPLRAVLAHIYYVASCSDCSGAGDGIPTLKRVELTETSDVPAWSTFAIAEGIENMQIDYGVDTDASGSPNGVDVNGSTLVVGTWPDVMSLKIHLLARALEQTVGYQDTKNYTLGTQAVGGTGDAFRRHVFVQTVRLVNPSSRRTN